MNILRFSLKYHIPEMNQVVYVNLHHSHRYCRQRGLEIQNFHPF